MGTRLLLVFFLCGFRCTLFNVYGRKCVTPYAASPFNGTSMPPYDGSAYHYNYKSRLPGGNPYRPLQRAVCLEGTLIVLCKTLPHCLFRCIVWFASADGTIRFAVAMGPRPGFFPEEPSQKKGMLYLTYSYTATQTSICLQFMIRFSLLRLLLTNGTRENDWECPKCGNVDFSFRTVAKPAKSSKADIPEGSGTNVTT